MLSGDTMQPLYASKKEPVKIGNIVFDGDPVIIAGPCSVESKENLLATIEPIRDSIHMIRGGTYKMRTSPYDFQGLGQEGLKILSDVSEELGLPCVSEVMCIEEVGIAAKYVDALQVGARNMYNYRLLTAIGKSKIPVILKRGFSATMKEWFHAAEYILKEGNHNVILCERGIRSFDQNTRNVLDLAGAMYAKQHTGLPVISDPSHGTGVRSLVVPMIRASLAAGLDGVMIEVHTDPDAATSDGHQTITPEALQQSLS